MFPQILVDGCHLSLQFLWKIVFQTLNDSCLKKTRCSSELYTLNSLTSPKTPSSTTVSNNSCNARQDTTSDECPQQGQNSSECSFKKWCLSPTKLFGLSLQNLRLNFNSNKCLIQRASGAGMVTLMDNWTRKKYTVILQSTGNNYSLKVLYLILSYNSISEPKTSQKCQLEVLVAFRNRPSIPSDFKEIRAGFLPKWHSSDIYHNAFSLFFLLNFVSSLE